MDRRSRRRGRYVGRKRELEASLEDGPEQPSYSEAILVQAARLLNDLGELWSRATDDERAEIAQNLFTSIRVRDGNIVSAKLARDEYMPLVASAEARVWMARPEGAGRALTAVRIPIEGAEEWEAAVRRLPA